MSALFPTLVDALRERARTDPGRLACVFLQDGEEESARLTFGELDERARAIAAALRRGSASGDRALLLYPPGLEFVAAFLGCLYAGVVAVPSYPPAPARPGRGQARLRSIAEDCGPGRVLAPASLRARIEAVAHDIPALERAPLLVTDEVPLALAEEWEPSPLGPDDLAFLQYTSGSTSEPKGVLITHGNLVHNEEVIRQACDHDERSTFVSWLPIYHDMGLIGSLLQPLYAGSSCVLMAPVAFLQKPVRWLRAISRWRAHTSGAPDFAYDLCVRKIPPEHREGLDLSSWRIAFDGSEPVRARTLEAFTEAFGPSGFRSEAFFPCYGLAEATLIVSGAPGTPPVASGEDARRLVGCGPIGTGLEVAIVDPESGTECGTTGEIWVSGPSVARGYWNRPEITEQTFGARLAGHPGKTFLRTGDLGFLRGGQLFVAGRLKDLIIVRGRNHYPQDLELTAADSHPALRGGAGAAFSIDAEEGEGVVLVLEIDIRRRSDPAEILEAARRAVGEEHEVPLLAVMLVRPGAVPKTTSGKVRRRLCRELFLAGELEPVAQWRSGATEVVAPETPKDVEGWLRARLAAKLGVPMDRVDPGLPLAAQGLDSLAAVELAHEIETAFGVELSISAVLESPDLQALASSLAGAPAARGARAESSDRLSAGERALWLLQQADPEDPASHVVGAARLLGDIDEDALRRAFQALVDRHPALRTTFASQDGEPVRRIHTKANPDLVFEDIQSEEDLRRRLDEEVFRPFDLERGPLLRVFLFRSVGERVLLLTVHHAVADFWSLAILARELGESYSAGGTALAPAFGAPGVENTIHPEAERYWLDRLSVYPFALDLPIDRPWPVRRRHRAADVPLALDIRTADRLRALGRGRGATLFPTLLATFQALLHRVTGQDRLLVGSPTAGRDRAADAGRVGYLVNPVVLASSVEDDPTFETFLDAARGTVLGALEHAVPFPLLVERLHPERDPSRSPVFQVAFALQRAPHGEEALAGFALGEEGARLETGGLTLESMALARRPGQFDLTLLAAERDGEIRASLLYDLELFDRTTIARWAGALCRLAEAVAADPGLRLSEAPLWSDAERWQLLGEWNDTDSAAGSTWVHEMVALQAQRQPDAVAVRQGDRELTYGELALRADGLAHRLRALGAGPEAPVAVLADRSPEQIVGILAALQAGAPYLPLDPAYPPERIAWMVADSGAAVLLTEEHRLAELPAMAAAVVILGGEPGEASPPDPLSHLPTPHTPGEGAPPPTTLAERPPSPGGGWVGDGRGGQGVRSDNLAYVIYTSGSTGRPKGVAVSHASLRGLVDWHLRAFGVTGRDVASHLAGLGFDASVWEVWPYLAAGASLRLPRLPDDEVRVSPERLRDWMAAEGVTVAFVPTVLAEPMMGLEWPAEGSPRLLLTGGDRLGSSPRPGLPFALWNNYGPTECTVVATSGHVSEEMGRVPSLGRPADGVRVHLLDRRLRPVPSGSPGEICLAGSRLARGYLRRPDLTAERFVPDPFSSKGGRIYRTGDLGRWTPDGRLEFLGRIDAQVQLRGVRVEPGEIEAALLAHPDVDAAVLVPVNGPEGTLRLDAFVAPSPGVNPTAAELREHLRSRLPAALVPAVIHLLPALPLTPNGKIDRAVLAKEVSLASAGAVPPRTPVEEALAGIWAELLGHSGFGVHDDFFALGGHSLLASRVVSRVRAALGAELPLRALFETPTVAGLAERLEGAARADELPLIPAPRDGDLPLSFAQQRLWFLHTLDPEGAAYNVPGALHLDGSLDVPALGRALREIARRHEALRTTFDASASGSPVQRIAPEPSVRTPLVDLGGLPGTEREAEAERLAVEEGRRPFDLRRGPLLRSLLLRLDDTGHRLVVNMHHIVADGWSLGVLLRELGTLYPSFAAGKSSPLPELRLQVADFAVWQRQWLDGRVLRDQMEWWKSRLAGLDPLLHLPTDRPRLGGTTRGATLRFELPEEQVDRLEALGHGAGASLFMTLLAGWKALLFRYTGQTDIAVGSPVANRGRVEVEDLIGCFVNTLVLRTRTEPLDGFRGLLGRMRETALDAFEHQDLPFERLVEELHPERELAHTPLFQVMFVLQNAPLPALHLAELGLELVPIDIGAPKFDLMLAFERHGARLSGTLEYRSELFDASTIARLVRHFERLLASAAADLTLPLGDLPMLADEERAQLLAEWNPPADRRLEVRGSALLHERFEAWAERTPGAVAVACEGSSLTYRELDRRANRLARRLRALGVAPGARVGLWLERSVEMAVGMLGALKAGAAYLPLDPSYPLERLAYMAKDGGISALVTASGLLQAGEGLAGALLEAAPSIAPSIAPNIAPSIAPNSAPEIARVLLDGAEILAESGDALPPLALPGSALAYVLYTSGSTGRPKGVACHHFGVVDLVDDFSARSPLPPGAVCSLWASFSFDASVYEVWAAWLAGGRLEIATERVRTDGRAFAEWLAEMRVESAFVSPPMLVDLAEVLERREIPLRRLLLGVEPVPEPLLAGIVERVPGLCALNGYGPTETTICCTLQAVEPPARERNTPVGMPVRGGRVYLLGPSGELVPAGVPGEVYIAGSGVTWGYLGRPDLTAERFLPDPYGPAQGSAPGGRMYRTGDLARHLADGALFFLGRIDRQIKLRGVRMEPDEIEEALRELGVREVAVGARRNPDGDLRLVAWVVMDGDREVGEIGSLREALRARLPEIMVPSAFVPLDALPLTVNGKVDRAALPDPDWRRAAAGSGFVAPRTMVEEMLAEVWAGLLGLDRIGIHDSFFDVGGHSLKAGQLVLRVRDAFGVELPVRTVFEAPTIATQAVAIGIMLVEQADPETLAQTLAEI